jgi:hypothetical protein
MIVLSHASRGLSINEIAEATGLKHTTVETILLGINEQAKKEMSLVITSRIALEYEKALTLLDFCLKRCLEIDSKATDQRVSLQAISTSLQILDSKVKLLSDSQKIAKQIEKAAIVYQVPNQQAASSMQQQQAQPTVEKELSN